MQTGGYTGSHVLTFFCPAAEARPPPHGGGYNSAARKLGPATTAGSTE